MKTRNIIFFAFLGLCILGGAISANAQNNGVQILFKLAGPDDEPMEPSNPKTPVLLPTVWQDGYSLDFNGTHDDYVLRIVDATDAVVYSAVVPSYQTLVWLPTYLVGTYRIELLTDLWLFYGVITL